MLPLEQNRRMATTALQHVRLIEIPDSSRPVSNVSILVTEQEANEEFSDDRELREDE
ncbi:hypothetical protein RH831_07510 [Halodesulfurarchaeum sp. HSR-GB]|uniref:hypothetical protein n=1 Tax=Halodesulfurarchaeum sp. HSR-GB TaxID=3074077 RepID=UPI00285B0180|nr:hypothetical protein [Halodesulfurarchaeum sp. HSR-GB]MDR5657027.1 hypothetical protein [Halodesulfurarchaeum sp. HSR-GB]